MPGECKPNRNGTNFLAVLKPAVEHGREIHTFLDNLSTHTLPDVEAWLAENPHAHFHLRPCRVLADEPDTDLVRDHLPVPLPPQRFLQHQRPGPADPQPHQRLEREGEARAFPHLDQLRHERAGDPRPMSGLKNMPLSDRTESRRTAVSGNRTARRPVRTSRGPSDWKPAAKRANRTRSLSAPTVALTPRLETHVTVPVPSPRCPIQPATGGERRRLLGRFGAGEKTHRPHWPPFNDLRRYAIERTRNDLGW